MHNKAALMEKIHVILPVKMAGKTFAIKLMKAVVDDVKAAVKMLVKNLINVTTVNMIVNHHIKEDVSIIAKILAKNQVNVDLVKAVVKVAVNQDAKAHVRLDAKVQHKLMLLLLCLPHLMCQEL